MSSCGHQRLILLHVTGVQPSVQVYIYIIYIPIPCDIHVLIKLRHPFVKNSSFVYEGFKQKCKKKTRNVDTGVNL